METETFLTGSHMNLILLIAGIECHKKTHRNVLSLTRVLQGT
jgi:hypothetical protein